MFWGERGNSPQPSNVVLSTRARTLYACTDRLRQRSTTCAACPASWSRSSPRDGLTGVGRIGRPSRAPEEAGPGGRGGAGESRWWWARGFLLRSAAATLRCSSFATRYTSCSRARSETRCAESATSSAESHTSSSAYLTRCHGGLAGKLWDVVTAAELFSAAVLRSRCAGTNPAGPSPRARVALRPLSTRAAPGKPRSICEFASRLQRNCACTRQCDREVV